MVDTVENFFITAVLVTHDGATWLPQVVAALSAQTRKIDRIIAVDTGSLDSSVKLLRAAGITVIEAERDLGYGDAIEIALDHSPIASSPEIAESEWIWLIHDDCAPARDALEIMVNELVDRPQVVIAGPKLLGWYDRDHLLEAGISIAINGARWTGLENREQDQGQQNFTREVMSVSTAAMLVKRSAFVELGGLDPNLALFRDDVDLGWRAHVAGFSALCIGAATVFHAEASASERRQVDVSEAFLHRPLLLDRRNAAYVLLVNSSWWMLPWVSLQLFGTSILRALFDLVAKLPGYAGDEIAAIGLLLLHPRELIVARRSRKKKRLLSPRIVTRFIPPRGSQIRAGFDRVTSALMNSVAERADEDNWATASEPVGGFTELGTLDDEFDDLDLSAPVKVSFIRNFLRRPEILSTLAITFVSLLAGSARYGQLSGGALSLVQTNARDLIANYFEPWHSVGMGSSAAQSPWVAILALASVLTLGHLSLFVGALYFGVAPLSFYIFNKTLRRIGLAPHFATVGGLLYVANPLLWTALNQGRLGTIVLFLLLPAVLLVRPIDLSIESYSWRRIFATSLLAALIGSFSPLLLAIWLLAQLVLLVVQTIQIRKLLRSGPLFDFFESEEFKPLGRRLSLLLTPLGLLLPWSTAFLIHPTQWLLTPGAPLASGSYLNALVLSPGGDGAQPIWLISPILIALLCALAIRSLHTLTLGLSLLLAVSVLLARLHVAGHGGVANVWSGDLLLLLAVYLIPALLFQGKEIIPTLRSTTFGLTHIVAALTVVLLSITALGQGLWVASESSHSLVRANLTPVTPAFVDAIAATPAKPKTVVISVDGATTSYFVSRGSEIALGGADVAQPLPPALDHEIANLISGSGLTSAKTFSSFGIQYLFVTAPVPASLASEIDGIGGYIRVSATAQGVIWKVVGAAPRVLFQSNNGVTSMIPSANSGATGNVSGAGTLSLGESYDSHWNVLLNGQAIKESQSTVGTPEFVLPQSGKVVLSYDGTVHRALISFQLLVFLISVVMALPYGRRKVEVPLEELV